MMKKNSIIEIIIIFIVTLVYNLVFYDINLDEIWCFGFCYNIVNGLIPYVDYNMIIGPIYPYLNAIFMYLFGNNLLVFHVVNSFIVIFIYILMKRIHSKSYYLVFFAFLVFSIPHYNVFCLLFFYLFCYLEERNANNYLIGVLLGVLIFTKINIGVFLCIPSLFIKDKSKLVKRILACELFTLLMMLIMMVYGNLSGFLNCTILGLFDFAKENLIIDIWIIFPIISFIFVVYSFFYKKEKNIILIYLLCFQVMVYPLFDVIHTIICFIPVMGYLFDKINLYVKMLRIVFYFFIFCLGIYHVNCAVQSNKQFNKDSVLFRYKLAPYVTINGFKDFTTYLKSIDDDKKIYIFEPLAYGIKIEAGLDINKFDLVNDGNMGYMGDYIYLNEIKNDCNNKKCVFIINYIDRLYADKKSQTSRLLVDYVVNNCNLVNKTYIFEIYEN